MKTKSYVMKLENTLRRAPASLREHIADMRVSRACCQEGKEYSSYGTGNQYHNAERQLWGWRDNILRYLADAAILGYSDVYPGIRAEMLQYRRWARRLGKGASVPYSVDELASMRYCAAQGGDR